MNTLFVITVGIGQDKDGHELDGDQCYEAGQKFHRALATAFGGYTSHKANGGWVSPRGAFVQEPAVVCHVYADAADEAKLLDIVAVLKADLNQESVVVAKHSVEVQFV